jgi:hypothetical protein
MPAGQYAASMFPVPDVPVDACLPLACGCRRQDAASSAAGPVRSHTQAGAAAAHSSARSRAHAAGADSGARAGSSARALSSRGPRQRHPSRCWHHRWRQQRRLPWLGHRAPRGWQRHGGGSGAGGGSPALLQAAGAPHWLLPPPLLAMPCGQPNLFAWQCLALQQAKPRPLRPPFA